MVLQSLANVHKNKIAIFQLFKEMPSNKTYIIASLGHGDMHVCKKIDNLKE